MTKVKFTRVCAGLYRAGDWEIGATEGEQRSPGYTWYTHNPTLESDGENYFGSLAAAKAYVLKWFEKRS